jgi:hypothetical protein
MHRRTGVKFVILCVFTLTGCCFAYSKADFNRDEIVNSLDFGELADEWLKDPNELPPVPQVVSCATFVIAAQSSPENVKLRADYVCDGNNDQVEIQQAVDNMPSIGGVIYLAEGEYRVSGTITVDKPVFFRGAGVNWHINGGLTRIYPVGGLNGPIIDSVGDYYLGGIFDIGFDGCYMTNEVNYPAVLLRANGGDYHIERCGFYYLKFLKAVEAGCHNVWIHDTCFEETKHSSADCFAVHISVGSRNRIINCHFRNNKNCIWFEAAEDWVAGCDFHDTDCSVFRVGTNCGMISDSMIFGYDDVNSGAPMMQVGQNVSIWNMHDCYISAVSSSPLVQVASGKSLQRFIFHDNTITNFNGSAGQMFSGNIGNSRFAGNIGYTTANGGTASVANGYAIAHGLVSQPTKVSLTASVPTHIASVAAVNSSSITVGLKDIAGQDVTVPEIIYWCVECK